MSRPRSRSGDTHDHGPMWDHPEPDRPHDPSRTWVWNYTPALRRIRKVLILVDIIQILSSDGRCYDCHQMYDST